MIIEFQNLLSFLSEEYSLKYYGLINTQAQDIKNLFDKHYGFCKDKRDGFNKYSYIQTEYKSLI